MRLFACPACGERLFFHNFNCACGAVLCFDPRQGGFVQDADACANRDLIGCNWRAEQPGGLCGACATTKVIPDLDHGNNRDLFADAERAKRWVLTCLGRWGWFTERDPGPRPVFDLLSEETSIGKVDVVMGHDEGLVTINVVEANPAALVARREALGERFRTMIGHFRHELGHFFFERLRGDPAFLDGFRGLFGDESQDYAGALKAYYDGERNNYDPERHVTHYAASHPHEDWAESFAHLLHLVDIADSFAATNLTAPVLPAADYDAYAETDAERLIATAAELGIALNHVNRSMGLSDLYPFVLPAPVREKLCFAHRWIRQP